MRFGIKKLFGGRPPERIEGFRLSVYGKLPIYKDYILWECTRPGAEEFKQWLDQAFGFAWEEFGGKNARARNPFRVLAVLPGRKHVVAACLWPSADEGNMRKFPFVMFGVFPHGNIAPAGADGAIRMMLPVWRAMEAMLPAIREQPDVRQLYSFLQVNDPVVEGGNGEPGADLNVGEWVRAMARVDGAPRVSRLDMRLSETITAYNGFPEGCEALAVRVPLAAEMPLDRQTEAWTSVFAGNIAKAPELPTLLIERDDQGRDLTLTLVWRELMREDGRLFSEKTESFEYMEDFLAGNEADSLPDAPELPDDVESWAQRYGR